MNNDQITNLIQTLGKMAGAAAIAHGVGNSATWEAVTGAVIAFASWYWSHQSNATPTATTPNPNPILK